MIRHPKKTLLGRNFKSNDEEVGREKELELGPATTACLICLYYLHPLSYSPFYNSDDKKFGKSAANPPNLCVLLPQSSVCNFLWVILMKAIDWKLARILRRKRGRAWYYKSKLEVISVLVSATFTSKNLQMLYFWICFASMLINCRELTKIW